VLMFYYRPTGEYAYWDIKYLDFDVPFGMIMRNMHRWSAHGMVIFIWLHMFRVFMTGSYKPPREFNWVVGVNLLTLTLLLSFITIFPCISSSFDALTFFGQNSVTNLRYGTSTTP